MPENNLNKAVKSVFESEKAFCKFLSANDTGAIGAHQVGILVSKSAVGILFDQSLEGETILKRMVEIRWQNGLTTQSCFTYYKSKNELRITRFGRNFPYLNPDQTGALFVLTRQNREEYSGFFLETEEEIEEFLNTFNLGPTETNGLIDVKQSLPESREKAEIQNFIDHLTVEFPLSREMSEAARRIRDRVYGQTDYVLSDPDQAVIEWTNTEYSLFRALEYARYGTVISRGFENVDDFVSMANMVLNRRKSRAGKSLEHHLAAVFDKNGIAYTPQAVTEGNKKPDFLFPCQEAYHDPSFPVERLAVLAAKTTCKDRWRQVLNEADRLKDGPKYLCTLQQGISPAQMDEMQAENVILVVPKPYIRYYPSDRRDRIWTLRRFIEYMKEIEEKKWPIL